MNLNVLEVDPICIVINLAIRIYEKKLSGRSKRNEDSVSAEEVDKKSRQHLVFYGHPSILMFHL